MNVRIGSLVVLALVAFSSCTSTLNVGKTFTDAEKQTQVMLAEIPKAKAARSAVPNSAATPGSNVGELVSPRTLDNGELKLVTSRDWTSGFFPGVLWFLYEQTGSEQWIKEAEQFTLNIEKEKFNGTTHDMGFKVYCSFGTGYRLTNNEHYKQVIIQSAKTLATRFNPVVGTLRSWDHNRDRYKFPVIIDNMLNLELLFAATQLTGDSSFHKIAVSHANTTLQNHFRPEYSTYHVIDYDTATGKVIGRKTHQGYSDASSWARGQAWALYGYTMCYRFTKDPAYLKQAENVAGFLFNHPRMPKDLVPYYDYDAPDIPNAARDASAAALHASALYELSLYSSNGAYFKQKADETLKSLTDNYRSPVGENKGFLLLRSTGSAPSKSEVDVPLIYADYYYLEALLRSKKLKEGKQLW